MTDYQTAEHGLAGLELMAKIREFERRMPLLSRRG